MRLVISAAAGRDLDDIYDYTAARWGSEQAANYVGSFDAAFEELIGQARPENATAYPWGHRRLRHERHIIFYRVFPGMVRIVRILHPRMDLARHLR